MKKPNPNYKPDYLHTYLEIARRFIYGVRVKPGYEEYQGTAKLAIKCAIRMTTPPQIRTTTHKILGCPGGPARIIPPIRIGKSLPPIPPRPKSRK